ncbi:MAG: NAD-dependent epimerase/dehydratase family protein [Candidatus Tectomicrobia bacterium]|nr:NAD-dependent epimerase/dehydratase family protein [Candidatus Tectomicrobia bacterium]
MKALVTGATGFIGANLVRELLHDGIETRVIIRKESDTRNIDRLDIDIAYGDLRDAHSLVSALKGCTLLFHVAAFYTLWLPDRRVIYEINVEGTKNILGAALEEGVERVVYTSTVGTIGFPKDRLGSEEDFPSPEELVNDYKRSKWIAEVEALKLCQKGLPLVVVNPTAPVGPRDIKPTPTGQVIVDFLSRKIPGYVETGLNVVDVEDVARGHILAAQKGKIGERYILGHQNLSLKEIFLLLEEITGLPAPTLRIPYRIALVAGYLNEALSKMTGIPPRVPLDGVKMAKKFMYVDSSKAVKELELPQSSVKGALEKAVSWFKEHGYMR